VVSPQAVIAEIATAGEQALGERLEDPGHYEMFCDGHKAIAPWCQPVYELRPKEDLAELVAIKSKAGDMTAPVPRFQPDQWRQVAYQAMPNPPLSLVQTGPK
jgi:hypothetical protein